MNVRALEAAIRLAETLPRRVHYQRPKPTVKRPKAYWREMKRKQRAKT